MIPSFETNALEKKGVDERRDGNVRKKGERRSAKTDRLRWRQTARGETIKKLWTRRRRKGKKEEYEDVSLKVACCPVRPTPVGFENHNLTTRCCRGTSSSSSRVYRRALKHSRQSLLALLFTNVWSINRLCNVQYDLADKSIHSI